MAAEVERNTLDNSCLKEIPIIWVTGGPGSGKGTQCEYIARHFGYKHMASGELLRKEILSGSNRGLQIYKLMADGNVVPSPVIIDVIAEAMHKAGAKGYVLDGFPVDVHQAKSFEDQIGHPSLIIDIEVTDATQRDRLNKRGNFDDTEDSITKRIANFNFMTRPVLEAYKAKTKTLNGERPAEEISAEIEVLIKELK
ncbi:Adenylate kinase [Caligus rogercresseyi]|uniref:Adenylate kinase n=1 Tax=Caligus rogercresseyi TaxID=217165 RepID=C1BNM5_CALRO|nr:Adenylate kinase [Caligus rogercresseyi]QQP35705.1 Adenylate kinase [Caligus rogercresseyi]|eukprot:TRINITY_DN1224_c0_g1_i1.p1 TRINITY_DN1224_c0_g1~~TRINITY_DN1224_c0_g1_i1.p1  ORF type:complete len:197 (+),score=63.84 TRINITY_DN1224_c0_g1_i1:57-647(+)